jgi:hypothetical protein
MACEAALRADRRQRKLFGPDRHAKLLRRCRRDRDFSQFRN